MPSRCPAIPFGSCSRGSRAARPHSASCPLENSQAGSVNETYDLLQHTTLLQIVGEVVVRVDHALLGVPGARLEEIRRARSHWQALAQCEEFLSSMRIEPVPVHDTAGAARLIAESGARDEAAIASVDAAKNFGLAVLAERIQTEKENFTKFAVLGTEDPGLGAHRQDLDGVGGAGRARVAARRAASVRGAGDQPAQAGVAAAPRQAVRVRDVRRRDGVGGRSCACRRRCRRSSATPRWCGCWAPTARPPSPSSSSSRHGSATSRDYDARDGIRRKAHSRERPRALLGRRGARRVRRGCPRRARDRPGAGRHRPSAPAPDPRRRSTRIPGLTHLPGERTRARTTARDPCRATR